MKKIVILLLILFPVMVLAQVTTTEPKTHLTIGQFIVQNWVELLLALMAFIKVIVRLTPTLKDDKVFGYIDKIIEYMVPNITAKKPGGNNS